MRWRAPAILGGLVFIALQPQIAQASVRRHITVSYDATHQKRTSSAIGRWNGFVSLTNPKDLATARGNRTDYPRLSPELEVAIRKASEHYGVPSSVMRVFAVIESGGNPRVSTGSYYGVYQLSHNEFRKYGGRGNIFDLNTNTLVAARKLRSESEAFAQQFGREPTTLELYMIHQQGVGGAAMHMSNPDAPAWLNMHRTHEGQQKGPRWARLAIWGNVSTHQRAQFPSGVDSITSRQFMELWARKITKLGGGEQQLPAHAGIL